MEILVCRDPKIAQAFATALARAPLAIPMVLAGGDAVSGYTEVYAQTPSECAVFIDVRRVDETGMPVEFDRSYLPVPCEDQSTIILNPAEKGSARLIEKPTLADATGKTLVMVGGALLGAIVVGVAGGELMRRLK